jgi:hypothetical protein
MTENKLQEIQELLSDLYDETGIWYQFVVDASDDCWLQDPDKDEPEFYTPFISSFVHRLKEYIDKLPAKSEPVGIPALKRGQKVDIQGTEGILYDDAVLIRYQGTSELNKLATWEEWDCYIPSEDKIIQFAVKGRSHEEDR